MSVQDNQPNQDHPNQYQPNQDQYSAWGPWVGGALRAALAAGGPIASLWVVYGHLTPDQANQVDNSIVTLVTILTPLAAGVWSLWAKRRSSIIKQVARLPEVKMVVVKPVDATMRELIQDPRAPKVTG